MTKNADPDKYKYSGNGIRCDALGSFSPSDGSRIGKVVIVFGVDMSSLVH